MLTFATVSKPLLVPLRPLPKQEPHQLQVVVPSGVKQWGEEPAVRALDVSPHFVNQPLGYLMPFEYDRPVEKTVPAMSGGESDSKRRATV